MIAPAGARQATVLFVITLMFSSWIHAAPKINSIDGNWVNGSEVTISGSSFSSTNATPFFYDLVDNQTEVMKLSDGSIIPAGLGLWTQNTNQWGNPITIKKSGDLRSRDAKAVYSGNVKSYLGWPKAIQNGTNRSLYASWWFNPSQPADNGGSNKFIRVWDDSGGQGTRISWTQMHMTYDGTSGNSETNWGTTQPTPNKWNHLEIFVDSDKNIITTWLNGEVTHDVSDFKKASSSKGLTVALIGFDPSINENYANFKFSMTDIYTSPTIARVELSDSPTWDPKSHREVQEITSWSDSKIALKINLFAFNDTTGLYLYVVDKDGRVNSSGYPLKACSLCPSEPKAVTIK